MRITDNMRYHLVQRSITSLNTRHAEAARRASTGQRLGAPSDDPIAAAELVRVKAAIESQERMKTTVRDARGDGEIVEGALAQAGDLFQRAREIAVQAANGSLAAADRAALAQEVASLRQQLISIGNSRGSQGYLFAGSQVDAAAFDTSGVFQGDSMDHQVEIAPGVLATVNLDGAQAFTAAGGVDTFTVLADLETALTNDDTTAIGTSITDIDLAHRQLVSARVDSGLILSRLDTADSALEQGLLLLAKRQSDVGDADAFSSITELSQLTTVLEQAIAVSRVSLNTNAGLLLG